MENFREMKVTMTGSGSSAHIGDSEVRKETVVEREIGLLSKANTEVSMLLDSLENRLINVLHAQPKGVGNDTPVEELTPLPNAIRVERRQLEGLAQKINSILSRLEL